MHPDSPIYDELRPYSGDYEVWGGIVPDLSITEAREAFGGYHVKSGSMILLARPVQFVAEDTCFELTVKCYDEMCSDFVLFEDDGVTFDFEKGSYNPVTLKNCGDRVEVARSGGFAGRKYTVVGFEWVRQFSPPSI